MNPHFRIPGDGGDGTDSAPALAHQRASGCVRGYSMLGAGIEPAWDLIPRDFKSLASTDFATRAENDEPVAHLVASRRRQLAAQWNADAEKKRSGKRDSNPRPQPWQGCALPTELFPQAVTKLPVKNDANKLRAPLFRASQFQVDKTSNGMITSARRLTSLTRTNALNAS